MDKIAIKTFADTHLYRTGKYEENLVKFIMTADRIDPKDKSFEDVAYQIKRRQVNSTIYKMLELDEIVLCHSPIGMPKAFKVFAAKDLKLDKKLKIFVDVSDTVKKIDGVWTSKAIDVLIAHLLNAMTNYIYYMDNTRLSMNASITNHGMRAYSKLFTNIVEYLFKISLLETKKDVCSYLACLFYAGSVQGKDVESDTVISLAKQISKVSDRQIEIIDMRFNREAYSSIEKFIPALAEALKIENMKLDNFVEKWIYLYGPGTHFGIEYFPALAAMVTDTYVGAYTNNQKTIEKIVGGDVVDLSKTIFRLGEGVVQ